MEIIIFITILSLLLISYIIQRYIMKLSNKDILIMLKYDLKHFGIIKIPIGILILFSIIIIGPLALILLVLYLITFLK